MMGGHYEGWNGSNGKGSGHRAINPYAPMFGKATKQEARRMLQRGTSPEKVAAHFNVPVRMVRRLVSDR